MSHSPRWSGSRAAASRAAARVLVAGGLLLLAELLHRGPSGQLRDAVDVLALAAGVVSVVALAELLARAAWALAKRASARHAPRWTALLLGLPVAAVLWRPDPWAPAHDLATLALLGAGFVLAVRAGTALALRVDRARVRRRAQRWSSVAASTALLASLASATEWWPRELALGLAALAVFAAVLFARLVVSPAARVPAGAGLAQTALVLVCVAATARNWDDARWARLVSGEGGVLPTFRAVAHGSAAPLTAFASEGGDARWRELRDPAAPSAPDWQVLAGVARVAPHQGTSPLGDGGAQAVSFVTPDAELAQTVHLDGPVHGLRARVWLRRRSGGPGLALKLVLEGPGAPVERVVRPSEEWTEVRLEAGGDPFADGPLVHELDPARVFPERGAAFWAPLPPAFAPWAADVHGAPAGAALQLLEDGVPLGPAGSLHDSVREQGGGAYSHWQQGLYFSSSDGSDPRRNGRSYRALLVPADAPAPERARLRLALADDAAPAEVWLWGPGLEVARPAAEPDAAELAALRFEPTPGALAEAVRDATRHVVLVVLDEAPARAGRTGALGRLGDTGLRAAAAYAPSDRPAAVLGSLATGLPPPVVLAAHELGAPVPSWLELLRARGFHTFVQGVDDAAPGLARLLAQADERGERDPRAAGLEEQLLDVLRSAGERRVAAFAHWRAGRGGRSSLEERVARLQTGLLVPGLAREVLLVVTAASGDEAGSVDSTGRVLGRSERVLRVPLVARVPGLERAVELRAPVGLVDVVATLLDVAAPGCEALTSGRSLLAGIERADAGEVLPRPVLAWPDGARVLRLGHAKYVADERLGTHLLYDLASDPEERRPLWDATRAALLASRLEREDRRLELLARQLVSRHESELRQDLLAGLLVHELDAAALEPLLEDFWSLNAATRRFLMETLYARRVPGLAGRLDALARPRFELDDQLLLVLRAWAGSARAAQELPRRLDGLQEPARRWLLEILPDLPAPLVRELAAPLQGWLRLLHGAEPSPGSEAGRLLAVGAANLARALGRHASDELPRWLVELHETWSRAEQPTVATLREARFDERSLLDALLTGAAPGDEHLLARLHPSVSAARVLPELVRAMDGPAARERLLQLVDAWGAHEPDGERLLGHMLPGLRAHPDAEFSRQAVARVEEWRARAQPPR